MVYPLRSHIPLLGGFTAGLLRGPLVNPYESKSYNRFHIEQVSLFS